MNSASASKVSNVEVSKMYLEAKREKLYNRYVDYTFVTSRLAHKKCMENTKIDLESSYNLEHVRDHLFKCKFNELVKSLTYDSHFILLNNETLKIKVTGKFEHLYGRDDKTLFFEVYETNELTYTLFCWIMKTFTLEYKVFDNHIIDTGNSYEIITPEFIINNKYKSKTAEKYFFHTPEEYNYYELEIIFLHEDNITTPVITNIKFTEY